MLKRLLSFTRLSLLLLLSFPVKADDSSATLDSVQGSVIEKKSAESRRFGPASPGDRFFNRDSIRTGPGTRAGIVFSNGALLRVAQNTSLRFQSGREDGVTLTEGRVYLFSRVKRDLPVVSTPSVTAVIQGAEVVIEVTPQKTVITVLDGDVQCENALGKVRLSAGDEAITAPGKAPVKRQVVNPAASVRWTLRYPWIVGDAEFRTLPKDAQITFLAAKRALSFGDSDRALSELQPLTDRSESAALAGAESAVIHLVRDEAAKAESEASTAFQRAPDSPSVAFARSYLSEAAGDLPEASCWLNRVMGIEGHREGRCSGDAVREPLPATPVIYLRAAELGLAEGDLRKARRLSGKTPAADAALVKGFVLLASGRGSGAEAEFRTAVAHQADDGLTHLGLGLALIQRGSLEAGRLELERAVFLAPSVSVYRSYLGKAFFAEQDDTRAAHEYERAMELDPLDPTPYLYRSFADLSKNNPVGALYDVERSRELNGNRGVYRSGLLLDQDASVRSAELSEVFTTLGFNEVARTEAARSIERDYTNYSAHRLLADSTGQGFGSLNEVSRSEQRIATLLSPLSFNLLGQSRLGIGDYTSLLDKAEERTFIDAGYDKIDDVLVTRLAHAGRQETTGYYGTVESELRGGRADDSFSHLYHLGGVFHYQPSFEHKLLLELDGRYTKEREDGAYDEFKEEESRFSFGYHGRLSPTLHVLAEVGRLNPRSDIVLRNTERALRIVDVAADHEQIRDSLVDEIAHERLRSTFGNLQFISSTSALTTVIGAETSWNDIDRSEKSALKDLSTSVDQILASRGDSNITSRSAYLYPTVHLADWADLTVGLNYSVIGYEARETQPFSDKTREKSKVSPKIGLTLAPLGRTTIRAAFSEGIKRSSLEDTISIEPSLVGGINQIFTDVSAAESRLLALGVDQKLGPGSYLGVEGMRRHLVEPLTPAISVLRSDDTHASAMVRLSGEEDDHQDINGATGYYSQVLTDRWVTTLKHAWERGMGGGVDDVDSLELHRSEAALRYFDPSGWFAEALATRRDQKRRGGLLGDGHDAFWIVDAGVGYRLPNRHGSLMATVTNLFSEDFTYDQSFGTEAPLSHDTGFLLGASFNF